MGDESVRELERRWRQTGDLDDEGRWLLARVRAGQLSQAALEAAAWLGAPGAVRAAPAAAERPVEGDPWAALLAWCAGLDARLETLPGASHRAVLAEAERLLGLLEDTDPPLCRDVRAWLDELSARVADPRAAPSELDLPHVMRASDHPAGPALSWLGPQLTSLRSALDARRPLPLWPPALSPPPAVRAGWAPAIRSAVRDALAPWLLRGVDPIRTAASSALDRLVIASPCDMAWEQLTPRADDPRVRDCGACQLQVFDLSQLDRAEALALLAARTGRLCVRLYRRPDGRVMTRDCATSSGQAWDGDELGEIGGEVPELFDEPG